MDVVIAVGITLCVVVPSIMIARWALRGQNADDAALRASLTERKLRHKIGWAKPPDLGSTKLAGLKSRRVRDQVWLDDGPDCSFREIRSSGGEHGAVREWTCALVELPFRAPATTISSPGTVGGALDSAGLRGSGITISGLDDRYRVESDDELFIRELMDATAIEWFLRTDRSLEGLDLRLEFADTWLLVRCNPISIDLRLDLLRSARDFVAGLPDALRARCPR